MEVASESMTDRIRRARDHLGAAISKLEMAHATWSECVTNLHMAEIKMREAQQQMKKSYSEVVDVLNGEG
jgi:exonuclease VII small subunit